MNSIGIDIEKVSRFHVKKIKASFLKRVYTAKELRYCFNQAKPAEHLAGRFAAKEAVIKALAIFTKRPIAHRDIEIINDRFGTPSVFLKNSLANTLHISLSISHMEDAAIVAVIITIK